VDLRRFCGHQDTEDGSLRKGVHDGQDPSALPPAFRAEAAALAKTSDKGVPQLAHDLGVSEQALRGWIKRAEVDDGRGPPGELTTAEREELRRLRREVKILQQEREVLRKAAAFFARETL
jgi:transposase-like protein